MIRILFLGDIVGRPGREAVKKVLPKLRRTLRPDVVIANVENIAHGAGVTREKIEEMQASGIDGFTTGDHVFDVKKVEELLEDPNVPIIRPANWPGNVAGHGWCIISKGKKKLLLINLLGRVFMKVPADDPFATLERLFKEASKEHYDASFLDLHAEATSEKRAIAEVFDGKIDFVIGTHTHVQTNDPQILSKGTAFLSDVGMCGPSDSILGVDKELIIRKFRTALPIHHELAAGPCEVCGCLLVKEKGKRSIAVIRHTNIAAV
jgi:hypothetical protein